MTALLSDGPHVRASDIPNKPGGSSGFVPPRQAHANPRGRGRWILVAGILFLAAGAFWLGTELTEVARAWSSPAGPAPLAGRVRFEPWDVSLGKYLWGQAIPFTLNLVNRADEAVGIASVESSCRCASAAGPLDGLTVPARGSRKIPFVLQAGDQAGLQTETVQVRLTTGDAVTAQVSAEIEPTYELSASRLDLGEVRLDAEAVTTSVFLMSEHGVELNGPVESDSPWLLCEVMNRGNITELRVRLEPGLISAGRNLGCIVLKTTDGIRPELALPVSVVGVQDFDLEPTHVFLLTGESQVVTGFDSRGARVPVTAVESSPEWLECRVDPDGVVRIARRGGANSGQCGTVQVRTKGGLVGRIRVTAM